MRVVTVRVLFGDTDGMGVVYYANYLRYFEAGRVELFRALGYAYGELTRAGIHLPVTEVAARYLSPARYDDRIDVHCGVAALKRASIVFIYRLTNQDGILLAEGETVHAFTDPAGKIVRVPAAFLGRTGLGKKTSTEGG